MPLTKYETKRWVYIPITAGSASLNYAFLTNIKDSESTELGQVDLTSSTANVVIGCSYPKPSRATRRAADKIVSSYVASASIPTAKAAGYTIQKSNKRSPLGPKQLMKPVSVDVNGLNYGWLMPNSTYTKITANKATLGITDLTTTADFIKCVVGAEFPKPARIRLVQAASGTDGATNVISTWCTPDVDLTTLTGAIGSSLEGADNDLKLYTGLA